MKYSDDYIKQEIEKLKPWYQNIELNGIYTKSIKGNATRGGNCSKILSAINKDLSGKTVLDIGCNAGYFSLECKKRNALYVKGIDYRNLAIKQAKFCSLINNLDIDYEVMNILNLDKIKQNFDIVLFIGVLYHLTDLHNSIKKICEISKKFILLESATCGGQLLISKYPLAIFNTEKKPGHWLVNISCIKEMFKKYGNYTNFNIIFKGNRTCIVISK